MGTHVSQNKWCPLCMEVCSGLGTRRGRVCVALPCCRGHVAPEPWDSLRVRLLSQSHLCSWGGGRPQGRTQECSHALGLF